MRAILGNKKGVVKPWWLPFDFVFCRIEKERKSILWLLFTTDPFYEMVIVVRNNIAKNIYGLPVEVENGAVVQIIRA